jgi:LacI family transcriptional regulator
MRRKILGILADLQEAQTARKRTAPIKILLIHPVSMGSVQVFRELLQGIHAGLEEVKGRLTLAVHQPPLHATHTTSVLLHDPGLRPDGVILMGAMQNDPILSDIREENIPCILLARETPPEGFSAVGMDNFEGARRAVEHLLKIGHRKIVFLGGNEEYEYTRNRRAGYEAALAEKGLSSRGMVFLGTGEGAVKEFLDRGKGATAAFFVNDEHAAAGMKVFKEKKIRVPGNISVIGFDDTADPGASDLPLSSVSVPRFEIGELAVKALADLITRPAIRSVRIILRTRPVIRESSVQPPSPQP